MTNKKLKRMASLAKKIRKLGEGKPAYKEIPDAKFVEPADFIEMGELGDELAGLVLELLNER